MNTVTLKAKPEDEVEITLNGEDLADLFWRMHDEGQAEFFNCLGTARALGLQLQAVTDNEKLNPRGRWAMSQIGEFAATNPESNKKP